MNRIGYALSSFKQRPLFALRSLTSQRYGNGPVQVQTVTGVPIGEELNLEKVRYVVKRESGIAVMDRRYTEFHIAKEVKNALLFVGLHDDVSRKGTDSGDSAATQKSKASIASDSKQERNNEQKVSKEPKGNETTKPVQIASSMKNFFVFGNGSVVFWNLNEKERESILQYLRQLAIRGYTNEQIVNETERVDYAFVAESPTRINKDRIEIEVNNNLQRLGEAVYPLAVHNRVQDGAANVQQSNVLSWLEIFSRQYAFSDALSSSVKLGIWEAQLLTLTEFNETLISDLESGKRMRVSRNALMRNVGELYRLRHFVNIASSTIETPDVYWDLPHLEAFYARLKAYLTIASRTRTMNEKLTLCCELTDLLRGHLNDKHHTNLEWLIIILIATEVCLAVAKHF